MRVKLLLMTLGLRSRNRYAASRQDGTRLSGAGGSRVVVLRGFDRMIL
jgi:hypothetical protein